MASKSLGTLTIDMIAKTGNFEKGMSKAERSTYNFKKNSKKNIDSAMTNIAKGFAGATVAIVGYTTALATIALKSTQAVASQTRLAEALHTSYDSLTSLNLAFADKGIDNFESSMNRLNRRLGAAELGRGAALKAVEELNLNLKELSTVEADERLAIIADRIKEVSTSSEMAARFAQDLGFEQKEAVNFFLQGGDAIREYSKRVEKLGLALSDVDAKRIEEAHNAMGFFGDATKGATQQLSLAFAPAIVAITEVMEDMLEATGGLSKYFSDLGKVAIQAFSYIADGADIAYRTIGALIDSIMWLAGNATRLLAPLGEAFGGLVGSKDIENYFKEQLILAESMVEVSTKNMNEIFERNLLGEEFRKKYKENLNKTFEGLGESKIASSIEIKGTDNTAKEAVKSYEELLGIYSKTQALQNSFNEELKNIEKSTATAAQKTELIALASQKYNNELEKLNEKKGYLDILGEFDKEQALANDFVKTIEEINDSASTHAEKLELMALATQRYEEALKNLEPKKKTFDELLGNYDKNQAALNEYNRALEEIGNSAATNEEKIYLQALALERLNESLETSKTYWDQWLEGAQNALENFDELGKTVVDNFTSGFGNAFEKVLTGASSLKDGFRDMMSGLASSVINAIGQMIAQWMAYEAVQLIVGKQTQATEATRLQANALAMAQMAGLNAFASTAAIPVTGPALAPAAMAAALGITLPFAGTIGATALAGMAHDGLDSVPKTGTWLLEKGERVITSNTSAKLDKTLDRVTNNKNNMNNNFYISGELDQRTQSQIAMEISRKQRLADLRLGR